MTILISCTKTKHEFTVYKVDLMKDSYVKNNIRGFVKTWIVDGKTYKIDSTILDNNGNILNVFRLMAWGGSDTFKYDSLDRLTFFSHKSDTWRDFKIFYEQIPEERKVIQRWIDVTDNDSIFSHEITTLYNSTLDTILSESSESINNTIEYKYLKNRLVEIGPDNQNLSKAYFYDHLGQLEQIITYLNDRPFEIEFVSTKTGLIDSVLSLKHNPDVGLTKDFDFKKIKIEKEDMNYYTYFK